MPDVKPDHFPAPMADFQSHPRTTPRLMGGSVPVLPVSAILPPRHAPLDPVEQARTRAAEQSLTRVVPLRAAGIMPAAGALVIDVDGPQIGFVWDLKQLFVGPVDLSVTPYATGVSVVLFVRSQSAAADVSANQAKSLTTAWPAQSFFGRHECPVAQGEQVQVMVMGLAAGTVVTVGGAAEETAADMRERWSL